MLVIYDFQAILSQFDTFIVGYYPFYTTYLISLCQRTVCVENRFEVFCKGNTWNPKMDVFEPY